MSNAPSLASPVPFPGQPTHHPAMPAASRVRQSVDAVRPGGPFDEFFVETLLRLPAAVWAAQAPEGAVVFANPAAHRTAGMTATEPAWGDYLSALSLLDDQSRPVHRNRLPLFRALHEGVELQDWEATVMRPDGSLFAGLWNTSVIRDDDGRPTAAIAVLTDIDARRRREQQLRRTLVGTEQAGVRKSRFFSAVCHDLRSRLNSITLMMEALALRPAIASDSGAGRDLDEMGRAARQMGEALDELVGDARPHAAVSPRIEPFSLNELTGELVAAAAPKAQSAGLRLTVEQPAEPVRIRADRVRLRQIVHHLLHNALTYTAAGTVTMQVVAPPDRKGALRISIRDTGPGIPAGRQRQLFEEPAELPRSAGDAQGLGLPLCRRWVELLGGRLELHSEPGVGSTFTVVLPADVFPSATELAPEVPPLVLLVEDDPMTRRALSRLLRSFGYRTLEAANGREGVEIACRELPSLVLMDLMMPELDGMDAVRRLRDDPRTRAIPAVIVTGDITRDRRNQADELRVEGWVDKPVDVPRLRELIEGLLR